MTKKTLQTYPLPDNPDPQVYACHRVYLPIGAGFERAFFGSLAHLGKWVAWDRDDDHNGAIAAQSMNAATAMTLAEWDTVGCINIIQPPYTETLPDGRSPEEATTDDMIHFVFVFIEIIVDRCDEEVSIPDIVAELAPVWQAATGSPGTSVIQTLAEAIDAASPSERLDAVNPDTYETMRNDVVCYVDDTCPGLLQLGQYESYYQWLNCTSERIYSFLNNKADWLYTALSDAAAFLTGNSAAQSISHDDGGGAGFGYGVGACSWSQSWDFTVTEGPFEIQPLGGIAAGNYVGGVGYQGKAATYYGDPAIYKLYLIAEFEPRDDITISATVVSGAGMTYHYANLRWRYDGGELYSAANTAIGTKNMSGLLYGTWIGIGLHSEALPVTSPPFTLTQMSASGPGYNPFF